jgi:transcriptional regulator with XRE-family HTH domain
MIGVAERIRELRQRTGKTQDELAALLGMSPMSYFDIEAHDNELEMVPSLRQVKVLAEHLGVSSVELFGEVAIPDGQRLRYPILVARTEDYRRSTGSSEEALGDLVGWELRHFLTSENAMLDNYPVDFVKDLCGVLQLPWLRALP